MSINLNNNESIKQQVSIRLENGTINDIDKVIKSLKENFKIKLSRNQILELLIEDARRSTKILIDDYEYSFDELINLKK